MVALWPGTGVCVHVIGRRLLATEIVTDAVDYRYSGRYGLPRAMRGAELPDDVGRRCVELVASLGMVIGGVDLRRDLDGQYYCF